MKKTNKLPQKKTLILNPFRSTSIAGKSSDTDTTVVTSGLTTTHVFNR